MGTDWIDLYFIHRPSQNIPIDETLRALDDLVRAGKVNHIGCSTFPAWSVVESLWVSKEYGLNRFVTEQPPYHLLDRAIENEMIPMARSYGLGLLAWSPLAGGLLSGKYLDAVPDQARIQFGSVWGDRHFEAPVVKVVTELAELALEKSCTLTQLALAWCVSRPGISAAILGARTSDQWDDQIGALTVKLSDEDLRRIDTICPPGKTLVSYYHEDAYADFRPTEFRW